MQIKKKLLSKLTKKEIIKITLEQPKLIKRIEQLDELIELGDKHQNLIKEINNEEKIIKFNENDKYIIKEKNKIGNSYFNENEFEGLEEVYKQTERVFYYIDTLKRYMEKFLEENIILKREKCEGCNKNKSFLFKINNKKYCESCIWEIRDKELKKIKEEIEKENE